MRLNVKAVRMTMSLALGLSLGASLGCSPNATGSHVANESLFQGGWWISKAIKTLHHGRQLSSPGEVLAFAADSRSEIVDRLLDDPRFEDTVLDFSLYYLGRGISEHQAPSLRPDGRRGLRFRQEVLDYPQAIAAARSVHGGDVFQLFAARPDIYFERPQMQVEEAVQQKILAAFDESQAALAAPASSEAACDQVAALSPLIDQMRTEAGLSEHLAETITSQWLRPLDWENCLGSQDAALARIREARKGLASLFSQLAAAPTAPQTGVSDLVKIDETAFAGLPPLLPALSERGFWSKLKGSSTNFNRKRAAYMLRTYLCDDLTPIDLGITSAGNAAKHASDPGCRSCHYKLDPMAGLFREHGKLGQFFPESGGRLVFDDDAIIDDDDASAGQPGSHGKFLDSWRQDGKRQVGYFVLEGTPHSAWTGDSLDDFFAFAGRSPPEIRQCLTRRMAQYFLGQNLALDGAWLEKIAQDAAIAPGPQSGVAFKKLVKSMILSNAFAEPNPVEGHCYDVSGATSESRPPCAVASLLESRCVGCHNAESAGGLDLSRWTPGPDGGFRHLRGPDQVPVPRLESLKLILESISIGITPSNPALAAGAGKLLMPSGGQPLSDPEKQRLYHWLNEEMAK